MRRWYLLLLLPFAGLLYPPLYATEDPELFGFPFFYWYQFAWVPVTALVTYFVYTGLVALFLNVVVAGVFTLVLGRKGRGDELDETREEEYDELRETGEPAPTAAAGVA